jgi:hypothetical protein
MSCIPHRRLTYIGLGTMGFTARLQKGTTSVIKSSWERGVGRVWRTVDTGRTGGSSPQSAPSTPLGPTVPQNSSTRSGTVLRRVKSLGACDQH